MTSVSTLAETKDKPGFLGKLALVVNKNIPVYVLKELSYDTDAKVRIKVVENPKIPVELLMEMSIDKDPEVRVAVVNNSKTPVVILWEMMDDPSPLVQSALAGIKYTTKDGFVFGNINGY